MSTLTDILTQFPNCRVTINAGSRRPARPKPREYDEKMTKSRGLLIRLQRRSCGYREVRNGRPVFEWVRESDLDEYERTNLRYARMTRRRD